MTWDELGRRETDRYLSDLAALNVAPPDVYARASEETAKIIELSEALIAQGHAYVRDGWVYFSVQSDPDFGKLADAAGYVGYANWLETANERGNFPDDPRKNDPLDFVLWQARQPGEPAWPSPWGPGRPGWHIECSAMAVKYLGPRIDIHGGGSDLVFPHHTCEIAQSENATSQRPFVKIWMHCGMTRLDGEKMSKSLGNLILVRNLLPTYTPDAVRLLLLSHHYRESWEYTEDEMRAIQALADRLAAAARSGCDASSAGGDDAASRQSRLEFIAALEDDFHTETAVGVLTRLAERAGTETTGAAAAMLRELATVVGLRLGEGAPAKTEPALGAAEV
jgi:L-cysteine:1D-myo-inositol 2-amino-2-deoxy-alpha-D-glucopyranoside ligase